MYYVDKLACVLNIFSSFLGTMQFSGRRRKLNTAQAELYADSLQFYGQPPIENISLTEFETFAVERLKCKLFALSLYYRLMYSREPFK